MKRFFKTAAAAIAAMLLLTTSEATAWAWDTTPEPWEIKAQGCEPAPSETPAECEPAPADWGPEPAPADWGPEPAPSAAVENFCEPAPAKSEDAELEQLVEYLKGCDDEVVAVIRDDDTSMPAKVRKVTNILSNIALETYEYLYVHDVY